MTDCFCFHLPSPVFLKSTYELQFVLGSFCHGEFPSMAPSCIGYFIKKISILRLFPAVGLHYTPTSDKQHHGSLEGGQRLIFSLFTVVKWWVFRFEWHHAHLPKWAKIRNKCSLQSSKSYKKSVNVNKVKEEEEAAAGAVWMMSDKGRTCNRESIEHFSVQNVSNGLCHHSLYFISDFSVFFSVLSVIVQVVITYFTLMLSSLIKSRSIVCHN